MKNSLNIPSIVETMVNELLDKNQRPNIRENYKHTLEDIVAFCSAALTKYESRK